MRDKDQNFTLKKFKEKGGGLEYFNCSTQVI